ncbi:hypothetical protein H074_36982 [Amycolatopsis decaplanina DSM 44594]|uniref:Uncharacterized protein n=1 Tax=Amycolatopsis decaplanina DSM 44594 TaxID=1284240 RepID=M2WRS0_9PSEU|nr:hypothetical protein H074_36982 [Amycolatopsis decaplanina DSM 44594]
MLRVREVARVRLLGHLRLDRRLLGQGLVRHLRLLGLWLLGLLLGGLPRLLRLLSGGLLCLLRRLFVLRLRSGLDGPQLRADPREAGPKVVDLPGEPEEHIPIGGHGDQHAA